MEGPAVEPYLAGAPGLAGRLIFAQSTPGEAHAAVVFSNDPVGDNTNIQDLAGRGYIVRTMADSSTVEARSGDRTRMNAAFTSGAHIVRPTTTALIRVEPCLAAGGATTPLRCRAAARRVPTRSARAAGPPHCAFANSRGATSTSRTRQF